MKSDIELGLEDAAAPAAGARDQSGDHAIEHNSEAATPAAAVATPPADAEAVAVQPSRPDDVAAKSVEPPDEPHEVLAEAPESVPLPEPHGRASPPAVVSAIARPHALGEALAALDRRDYATARRLFEALGRKDAAEAIDSALAALDRKDYAAAQGLFEALASNRPSATIEEPSIPGEGERAEGERMSPPAVVAPVDPPPAVIPPVETDVLRVAPPSAPAKKRGAFRLVAGLALLAFVGAALYASERSGLFGWSRSRAVADLAAPANSTPAKAALPGGAEEERAAVQNLRAALADATARLDRIERDYGARLDRLGERLDQSSASGSTDLTARLDALEKKAAAPPPAASATPLADLSARLDRLEKKAAAPAPAPDLSARLDKLEKKVAAAPAAKSTPPAKPAIATRAAPAASNAVDRFGAPNRLLQDYAVEDVQGGVAMVASRYGGPQQVTRGDVIPGAGRVLSIERRGGDWYVVTSGGLIASAPPPY